MDMVRGRVVDGEVQPGEDEGDGDGGVHGGGSAHGHGPLWAAALGPFFFLGYGAAVEIDLPLKTAAKGRNFRGAL